MDKEITIVARFSYGNEPSEEDIRQWIEYERDGDLIDVEEEDV